ncbi:MAG: hypothetical protein M5U30_19680 [Burkholderiaceae bacterium]|nr:hypothetical protein [Burkholderiaceae bacterium]
MAHRADVLRECRQQCAQRLYRQRVGLQVRAQLREHRRIVGFAAQCAIERIERRQPLRRRGVALVGEVVGVACEPVDRGDRRAQPRRHEQRPDGEVLVVVDRGQHGGWHGRDCRPGRMRGAVTPCCIV